MTGAVIEEPPTGAYIGRAERVKKLPFSRHQACPGVSVSGGGRRGPGPLYRTQKAGFRLRQPLDSGFRRNDDKEMAAGPAPEGLNPGPE